MVWKPLSCVAGAILINLTLGTFYSIGNVVPYLASYMRDNGNPDVTSEHGTWITAAFLLGQGLFIIVGSIIERNFNSRIACIVGCLLHCASTFATMWAINVSMLVVILIYGLGCGLGCGSAYMASIIAAQKWFPERKGLFTGIIVAGFGFGGLIFTNLQTLYLNPNNTSADQAGYFPSEVHSRVPHLFLYSGIIFAVAQVIGCALAFPPPAISSTNESSMARGVSTTHIHSDDILPNMNSGMGAAFSHKIFYIIGLMMMLVAPGVTFVNSLGKRYGQTYINDDKFLATVVAIAAVANATGRLFWGYLADRFPFTVCFLIKVSLFGILIAIFPLDFVLESRTLYCIWMLGLFFGFSGTFVLFPVFVEQVFGAQYHGVIYGLLYVLLAIASIATSSVIQVLIGPALADKNTSVRDKRMTRMIPCWGITAAYIMSYTILFLALPLRRLENAIRKKKDTEFSRTRISSLANRPDLLGNSASPLNDANATEGGSNLKSLGSIVKFSEAPVDIDNQRIKMLVKGRK